MGIEHIPRWVWIVISIGVGLAFGYVRGVFPKDDINNTLSQKEFEEALVTDLVQEGTGTKFRKFSELVVYPLVITERQKDPKNPKKEIDIEKRYHIVKGWYLYVRRKDNTTDPEIFAFKADVPFAPRKDRGKPPNPNYTVLNYLDSLKVHGVSYRYHWWEDPKLGKIASTGVSFIVIGLIWPTVINLLVYGQWKAPPREKFRLWGVKTKKKEQPGKKTGVTADDMAELKRLEEELEKKLKPTGDKKPAAAAIKTESPVKKLAGGPVEVAAGQAAAEEHHYEARKEDFYPVERKPTKPK